MYVISKDFAFSASHTLAGLHEGHPCGRMHGHNYLVRVELSSPDLDETGFVLDYGLLAPFSRWLDETLDHRHLNDVLPVQPSAENLARTLAETLRYQAPIHSGIRIAVGVSETPKTFAWWRP